MRFRGELDSLTPGSEAAVADKASRAQAAVPAGGVASPPGVCAAE